MYLIELYKLIEEGEGAAVEFKRKFSSPEKIAKELIAFANTKGGYILFGVDDDGKISGVESEKGELELINTVAEFYCEPAIEFQYEIICIKQKDVVAVYVPESKQKPHRLISDDENHESRVYIRVKDESVLASKETINILKNSNPESKPLKLTFGNIEKTLFKFFEENDRITVKGFKKLANISERRAGRLLVNLVRAEVIRHHRNDGGEYFTIA